MMVMYLDTADELNQARVRALADALGMERTAFLGYLIDAAVRRLTSAWVDDTDTTDATDSEYARALDVLADTLGMTRDDDPSSLIWEASRRLDAGQIIPADEAIDLPTGTVLIRVDPVTGEPFPLDRTNGAPFRVGETGATLAVGEHVAYRVLLRGQGEPGHQPGDVITGEQVPDLPDGARYVLCDEDGDPAPYGIVLAARDDYLPSVIMRESRYVILTVPS